MKKWKKLIITTTKSTEKGRQKEPSNGKSHYYNGHWGIANTHTYTGFFITEWGGKETQYVYFYIYIRESREKSSKNLLKKWPIQMNYTLVCISDDEYVCQFDLYMEYVYK